MGSADGHGQANNCTAHCDSGLFHLDTLRRGSIQQGQPFNTMGSIPVVTDPAQLKGWRTVAARGNAYPESAFSPVTALGDTKSFTIGMQVLNQELNSDNTSTYQIEYYDIPAAPRKPLISQYISAKMLPGESHTFNTVIKLAAPGAWADPFPAVSEVASPYASFFAKTYGTKPAYCPQGAVGMAFRGSPSKTFNGTTHTYTPGSTLYTDVLGVDSYLADMRPAGFDTVMVWQGQIFSSLLTPNHEQHVNAFHPFLVDVPPSFFFARELCQTAVLPPISHRPLAACGGVAFQPYSEPWPFGGHFGGETLQRNLTIWRTFWRKTSTGTSSTQTPTRWTRTWTPFAMQSGRTSLRRCTRQA
jgi:hypothetical protein